MSRALRRVGDVVVQLLLVALACEVGVRLALRVPSVAAGLPCSPQDQVACGLRTVALDPLDEARSAGWSDPDRGWVTRPVDRSDLHVNAQQIRAQGPVPEHPTPGRPRVLLLGDSFTFGFGMPDDATWAGRLQAARPDLEIVNLGQPGYGQDQMLLHWRVLGRTLHPDVVVLGFLPLDIERNGMRWRKPWFVRDGDHLALEGWPVPDLATLARGVQRTPWMAIVAGAAWRTVFEGGPSEDEVRDVTWLILEDLATEVRAEGAVPVFVHLPTLRGHFAGENPFTRGRAMLGAWCGEHDVPCGDLMPAFEAAWAAGRPMEQDAHWDAAAHALAAEGVERVLVDAGVIGPRPSAP